MSHRILNKRRNATVKPSRSLPLVRASQGALLSLGAPIGWVLVQIIAGRAPLDDTYFDLLLYGYMSISTALLFASVGWMVGRREAFITRLALKDSLTGLYNKRFFYSKLEIDFDQFLRDGTPLSIVLADLDHFKHVNDTFGHPAGDEVLRQVSALLQQHCRRNDVAARTGGEEFCIIMANTTMEEAIKSSERIRSAIEACQVNWQGSLIPIKASFGVAQSNRCTKNIEELIELADYALYEAKEKGRNQVRYATELG